MESLKLFTLLRTLEQKEAAAFFKQLNRRHKPEELPVKVFGYIRKFHPTYRDKKKMEITFAYQKIFDEPIDAHEHNRNKLLNTLSDLHLTLKEYLIQKKLSNDSLETQYLWASILLERGLESEFGKSVSDMHDKIKLSNQDSTLALLKHVTADYLFYYHPNLNLAQSNLEVLHQCDRGLDLFYALLKYKLACELANANNVFLGKDEVPASRSVFTEVDPKQHPLIDLYHAAYLLLTSPLKDNQYQQVEKLLFEHADAIDGDELHVIFTYLHNYATAQIREGQLEFWEKAHHLNKFGLKHGIFTKTGMMSGTQFNNIVTAACMAKDFEWAIAFIGSQGVCLPSAIRNDVVLLSEAIVAFEMKDFGLTLDKLMYVEFIDPPYALRSKSLIIMSYFELKEDPNFILSLCVALENYIRRNRGAQKKAMDATLKFVGFVKKLNKGQIKSANIYLEIQNATDLSFRSWLLEKASAAQQ